MNPIIVLRDKIIQRGIASVHKREDRPERIRGCLEGFRIVATLETPADFTRVLLDRQAIEHTMHWVDRVSPAEYWEYRCATAQVEHVWERLRIVWGIGERVSGMAIVQLSEIMKELGEQIMSTSYDTERREGHST